jgi:hypothetical protein
VVAIMREMKSLLLTLAVLVFCFAVLVASCGLSSCERGFLGVSGTVAAKPVAGEPAPEPASVTD